VLTFLARKPVGLYAKRNNSIEAVQHLEKKLRSRKLKHFRHKSFALQYVSFFIEQAQGVNVLTGRCDCPGERSGTAR
tara:strand:+ start:8841 stop:9071 length:231 start_codon:yes stop_codon:yes gene_type:complete